MRTCPDCAEQVEIAARVCPFCGYRFADPLQPPVQDAPQPRPAAGSPRGPLVAPRSEDQGKAIGRRPATASARRPGPILALIAGLAAACLGLVLLTAGDGPPAVETLSDPGQGAVNPQLAIDGSGRATIVWQRFDGSSARVQSVRLGADGNPEAVQTLSGAGEDALNPQVAIDGSDRATITWERSDGTNARIESVRLGADGNPEPIETLSEAGQDAVLPEIAIDDSDRATIVWQRSDGSSFRVQSVRLGADGSPETVQTLSDAGQGAFNPQAAIDGSDRATVVWRRSDGSNNRVQSVRLGADGSPEAVRTLSAQNATDPQVAIDDSDRATVVWRRLEGANFRIESVRIDADGSPEAVETLSAAGRDAADPRLAIDDSDRATIVWRRSDGSAQRIQSVRLAADGSPGAVQTLSEDGEGAFNPRLAIDGSDRATIVWQRSDGSAQRIQSVRLAANGGPEAIQTISPPGEAVNPRVALHGSKRGTIAWQRFDGTNTRIQSAPAYD